MADTLTRHLPGITQETLRVKSDLQACKRPEATFRFGDMTVDLCPGRDTPWLKISKPERGGVALRSVFTGGPYNIEQVETSALGFNFALVTDAGRWVVCFSVLGSELIRVRSTLTPGIDLLVPFWPRDLYVLDEADNPLQAKGNVEAAQRGVNTGLCYFCLEKPAFGSVLYVQNLTALNRYFAATKTKPDGVVGGEWPELGYQPPAAPNGNSPPADPLKAGRDYIISDVLLSFRPECAGDETGSARRFLDMMADIYPHLDRPHLEFHDWPARARKTLEDLKSAPEAKTRHYGHIYLHPYTASEYPDSMVQMSVASALDELETLFGKKEPYQDVLMAGMTRFFDRKIGTVRRYLPNVGKDKNADAVDSWYLYHPLMNLGRLALRGDKRARRLFVSSLDYAVKAARHFRYIWPVQFDVRDFAVITETRGDGFGQTDVAGLYTYVMLQAFQLTGDERFRNEARAAMKAAENMRFELAYQLNLTAWGVAACTKLWLLEEDERYLSQAQVFLASFVHNCELWDSEIGHAKHFSNFFGATCLHDAPYMAAYECFESFSAFDEVLTLAGEDLPPKMKLLMAEFRRFAFDRSWSYYPDSLPEDAIARQGIRNGHIDRNLSFPMEDLYGDGQVAGQVGQEIYGCGGAFIIAARGFYQKDLPFGLFFDYPFSIVRNGDSLQICLKGPSGYDAQIRVLADDKGSVPEVDLQEIQPHAKRLKPRSVETGMEFKASADGVLILSWAH